MTPHWEAYQAKKKSLDQAKDADIAEFVGDLKAKKAAPAATAEAGSSEEQQGVTMSVFMFRAGMFLTRSVRCVHPPATGGDGHF